MFSKLLPVNEVVVGTKGYHLKIEDTPSIFLVNSRDSGDIGIQGVSYLFIFFAFAGLGNSHTLN